MVEIMVEVKKGWRDCVYFTYVYVTLYIKCEYLQSNNI